VIGSVATLEPYLDEHWREVISTSQFSGPTDQPHPPNLATSLRSDLDPVDGAAPGTALRTLRAHVLDRLHVSLAIVTCDYGIDSVRNPDAAAALATAVNEWLRAEWVEADPRLRGAIVVPSQQPAMAAREIERAAEHPGVVAVHLPVRSLIPYGNRVWWPLLEAAVQRGLAVQLHFGGSPGIAPTASGWPTSWLEDYVVMASAFQSQLTSLVAEGTFERFPALRVSLLESGFAWLPAFLWRFDKAWRGLRREVPWTRRPPSEYVREHVRIGLQPVDGPDEAAQVLDEELVMFCTDYPHRHSSEEVPAGVDVQRLSDNARAHYGRRLRHP
jgi:predicted TIM-barrel fold metal-dependent hydrolase